MSPLTINLLLNGSGNLYKHINIHICIMNVATLLPTIESGGMNILSQCTILIFYISKYFANENFENIMLQVNWFTSTR